MTSGQLAPREGGVNTRGLINIDFPLPLFQVLHGNPGDYAWGEGGLNEIITQVWFKSNNRLKQLSES